MAPTVTVRRLADSQLHVGHAEDLDLPRDGSLVWVDVLDPCEDVLQRVAAVFGLHPLAIEDCLHFPQRPKIDRYEEDLFLVWVAPIGRPGVVDNQELDVFLGKGWLVTVHVEPLAALDEVAADAAGQMARGMEWVLHSIIDRLVDGVFPLVDAIGDGLEELEDQMLESAQPRQLERLFGYRRNLLDLHKIISPERDVLRALVRNQELIGDEAYRYFQDVGDHLARVADAIEMYRELAASAMDIYLSAQSNRMNRIMKQLTVVATIFMPLTLISGIYGMNFRYMPELGWRFGYGAVMFAMLLIAAGMLALFRRRDWW